MNNQPHFNYIVTIHNKQELIHDVLIGLLLCCRDNSRIYAVLDGCTDDTEKIVDEVISRFASVPITKVCTPDVHEILSINAGLKAANQEGEGYNIILQDDVVLCDFMWETKVAKLYEYAGNDLGFVSFRLGANLTPNLPLSQDPLIDHTENAYGHGLENASVLLPGQLAYRDVVIKSPVCIPFKLVREVGLLDERLAPYMCDDIDYSIRCLNAGYRNAVFALRFQSDVDWGSTRKNPSPRLGELQRRNILLIETWYEPILTMNGESGDNQSIEIPGVFCEDERLRAQDVWTRNQKVLSDYVGLQNDCNFIAKVKRSMLRKVLAWKRRIYSSIGFP